MTACRSNLMLSARSQTRGPINFLGSQKGPALSAGPRWGRHVTRLAESLGGEFPAPARVPKSRLWNWFHGPFGRLRPIGVVPKSREPDSPRMTKTENDEDQNPEPCRNLTP